MKKKQKFGKDVERSHYFWNGHYHRLSLGRRRWGEINLVPSLLSSGRSQLRNVERKSREEGEEGEWSEMVIHLLFEYLIRFTKENYPLG